MIRGGENVYCAEIEAVLFEHPDVVDVAIIGVPHQVLGEEVGAVVVRVCGFRRHCRRAAARTSPNTWRRSRSRPTCTSETSRCPATPPGKVLKRELREELAGALTRVDAARATPTPWCDGPARAG